MLFDKSHFQKNCEKKTAGFETETGVETETLNFTERGLSILLV
jgi:hypothetical protein